VRAERLLTMIRPPRAGAGEETRQAGRAAERRLVRAAQGGSSEALEALFKLHWPAAFRSAYYIVHDAAAAEDIAQEAFLSAVRALDRFDGRRPFAPWINRIVVNRAIDFARARTLRREVGAELGDRAEAPAHVAEISDRLLTALAGLAPDQRAVVVLRYLLDWTPGEIARALGIPRGTVNSRLRRALDQLAGTLEDER